MTENKPTGENALAALFAGKAPKQAVAIGRAIQSRALAEKKRK